MRPPIVVALAALFACLLLAAGAAGKNARSIASQSLPPVETGEGCEFIAAPSSGACMLPFPDDYYTAADPTSATGRRIAFKTGATPTNVLGEHVDATPYEASDGFSPGSVILVKIPGVQTVADVSAMRGVPINRLSRYKAPSTSVVVIDAQTGQRWPIWTEIDSTANDPSKAVLEIHPAVNFTSGHRYIVALRNLRNAAHQHLEAPAGFQYYRDDVPSEQEAGQRAPAAFRRTLHRARSRGRSALEPVPRVGLHRRKR